MEFTFEDAVAPKIERTGRKAEPNPFVDVIAQLVKDGKTDTGQGKSFTVPGLAAIKDNANPGLAKVRKQLTTAGDVNGVTVRWAVDQKEKVTKTNPGTVLIVFHIVTKIERKKSGDTTAIDNAPRENITETPAAKSAK